MSETISPAFTFVKSGVYYFSRRIPSALRDHYSSPRISHSLRTRSARVAEARARRAADQLDEYWYHLISQQTDIPGRHLLKEQSVQTARFIKPQSQMATEGAVTLSEAVGIYLRLKGVGKPETFHRAAHRACGYVLDVCGDKPLNEYNKTDANRFRDALLERGLAGSSMTRIFGTVRSVTNFAASETGLEFNNPFSNVYYDREAGVSERQSISQTSLEVIARKCIATDDDLRWLVALIADTGMRLAEAAGLLKDDFVKDETGAMHVVVRPHPWRRLKTKTSERLVPLEGISRWAAERVLENPDNSEFAFPRYNKSGNTNANSASAALNKWVKEISGSAHTMHGFRHAMRDRLRAVECPSDVVDQIGGWQTEGVGHGYGSGYPLDVLRKWMKAITGPTWSTAPGNYKKPEENQCFD